MRRMQFDEIEARSVGIARRRSVVLNNTGNLMNRQGARSYRRLVPAVAALSGAS